MEKEVFSNHAQKAQAYYTNAVTKRNEYTSPITIAHHRGTNCACGKECPGEHAEIKLLKAFPGVPDFEMGITSPMCDGRKYLGNNCQENIKNGYEKNKVIFAQDPGGLFVFPTGHQARIGASSLEEKNYCMICNKEINGGEICDDCEEMINDDSPFDFETTLN